MATTSKRLEFFLSAVSAESSDPMTYYGLAMEYRALGRFDEALAAFESLRARWPEYVPAYLMCGMMLVEMGRAAEARSWFVAGIDVARAGRNAHAVGELESALAAAEE
jgi:tetratricopeptide (TPR) repeat protein